jgi:hypothetical protein
VRRNSTLGSALERANQRRLRRATYSFFAKWIAAALVVAAVVTAVIIASVRSGDSSSPASAGASEVSDAEISDAYNGMPVVTFGQGASLYVGMSEAAAFGILGDPSPDEGFNAGETEDCYEYPISGTGEIDPNPAVPVSKPSDAVEAAEFYVCFGRLTSKLTRVEQLGPGEMESH